MRLFVVLVGLFMASSCWAEVAVSIRYFKPAGESHYHLFLFRDDGAVVRQLTAPENANDVGPRFARDGMSIFFLRKPAGMKSGKPGSGGQVWQIGIDGKGLRRLKKAPLGFPVAEEPPAYCAREQKEKLSPVVEQTPDGFRLKVSKSNLELVGSIPLAEAGHEIDPEDLGGFTKLTLRETAENKAEFPFEVGNDTFGCYWMTRKGTPILHGDGVWAAFYYQLTGSSDFFRVGAIDLLGKRVVSLTTRNPVRIVPHGKRAGFFSLATELYQELPQPPPNEPLLVNCSYLDWWDKDFKRVRFAKSLSLFGGASVRVKGEAQLDLPYLR